MEITLIFKNKNRHLILDGSYLGSRRFLTFRSRKHFRKEKKGRLWSLILKITFF